MKLSRYLGVILSVMLIASLILPAVVYAEKPPSGKPSAPNVEIVKKAGAKGVSLMGPPSSGPKPHAATGILGEEVTGERYAILIGISDYPGEGYVDPMDPTGGGFDLHYADDDAIDMALVLTLVYGFNPGNITLLMGPNDLSDPENSDVLDPLGITPQKATKDNIVSAIEALKLNVGPNDEVVFHFSGHGVKRMPRPTPSQGGGQVGIVTWGEEIYPPPGDFGFIWDKELKEAFSGFETDRIVLIFDCCLAGGMIDLGAKGRVICMATTQNGVAAETLPGMGWDNGLFTYFLLAGILEGPELEIPAGSADFYDHNANGSIWEPSDVTVEEAFDFARSYLQGMSLAIPELWQIPTISDRFWRDLLL